MNFRGSLTKKYFIFFKKRGWKASILLLVRTEKVSVLCKRKKGGFL